MIRVKARLKDEDSQDFEPWFEERGCHLTSTWIGRVDLPACHARIENVASGGGLLLLTIGFPDEFRELAMLFKLTWGS